LKEKAIETVGVMLAKGSDREDILDVPGFFVSVEKRRLCLGVVEVDGKRYYICQSI
jgi:hypothetical protein